VTRYQQGTYGLSQDLRESRRMGMELSRELAAVKKELEETKYELNLLREINKYLEAYDDRS
jgi:GTP cyclohydrolase FolE2